MTTKTTGTTRIEGLVPVVPTPLRIRGIMERHVSPHSAGSGTISEFLDAMECQIVGIVSVVRTTDTVVVGGS